uniref:Death domain-containing protein n=1 Tax=Amphimedon queenslandica TaxID=400682 RepID=A0A1X7T4F9_AMPQE
MDNEERVPLLDAKALRMKCFKNFHLNDHFHHMVRFLQELIPKGSEHNGELVNSFLHCVPERIALVNIWDMASSNTVHHLLSALEGYLFRSHLWLFVDLDEDLEKLDENFEIPKNGRDGAILLKQRPRLHYLLRSCWSTRDNNDKERQREDVCTMFAKHRKTDQGEAQSKVKVLKEKVQPVASHIGVAGLLDERIEIINLDTQHKRLNEKFQRILLDGTKSDSIPLSWLFLRSLFYRFPKTFVSKHDLMEMAKECDMDECSVKDFCKFFTSFGSIIDLSLVDPRYQHVIVKPITFLQSLDSFFSQQNQLYPSMDYGIVPEKACRDSFKDDWPIFMDALECLNLATPVTSGFLEMPPDVPPDRKGNYYYIPLCCTGPLIDEPDPYSVHLLTSISSPHFFKQVSFVEQLLETLPEPVLVPCKNVNQTIIRNSSTNTTITISSHVPAIKLKVDKPNEEICALIIKATEKIADESHVPVKYKFVQFCVQNPITKVESLPSASYHHLPESRCKKCRKDPKFEKLLKVWTEALRLVCGICCCM